MTDYSQLLSSFQLWLSQQEQYTARSQTNYLAIIEHFLTSLIARAIPRLNDVDMALLDRFIHYKADDQRYAPGTVLVRRAALTAFFTWAYQQSLCREHFMLRYRKDQVQLKSSNKQGAASSSPPRLWTLEEQYEFVAHLTSVDLPGSALCTAALIALILATGLYAQEVCALTSEALQLETGKVLVTQGLRTREVLIDKPFCEVILERWLTYHQYVASPHAIPYLFTAARLQPVNALILPNYITLLRNHIPSLKPTSATHLRQMAVMRWFQAEKSYEAIQTQFGFTQIASLKRYLKNLEVEGSPPKCEGKYGND